MNISDLDLLGLPAASFANSYGERFTVMSSPSGVLFAGDETEWEIQHLFQDFMFSPDELFKLGHTLIGLARSQDAQAQVNGGVGYGVPT